MEEDYFTVDATALTIPKRGALAIYAGEKPKRRADGTICSMSLRFPVLIVPPNMLQDEEDTVRKIAALLNDHAHLFFDSARAEQP